MSAVKSRCRRVAIAAAAGIILLGGAMMVSEQSILIWNRTASAPQGLYWARKSAPSPGDWAVLSADSETARWIAAHGFLAPGWPIIKRVRAGPGDEICRVNGAIFINGGHVADAFAVDQTGAALPSWRGCRRLAQDEIFLLNDHPKSLDGRYFGVVSTGDLEGKAVLIWRTSQ